MSIDDDVEEALGSAFGWDRDDIREMFIEGEGEQVARYVCGQCSNDVEVGSIRLMEFKGELLLVAGRRQEVAIRETIVRRILFDHDAPDHPDVGHRRAPYPLIIEEVDGGPLTGWCRKHGVLTVEFAAVVLAIAKHNEKATQRPPKRPPTVAAWEKRRKLTQSAQV